MCDTKVSASSFSLALLLDEAEHVSSFEQEIRNAGLAEISSEACIMDEMQRVQVPIHVPGSSLESLNAMHQL